MPEPACSKPGCERTAHTRGMCRMHYQRELKSDARRARKGAWQSGSGLPEPRAQRAPVVTPAAWHSDLTQLRRALPVGTGIGVGPSGVVVVVLGEPPRRFASVEAALEFFTRPAATPKNSNELEQLPIH